jgi:hypothetical protein
MTSPIHFEMAGFAHGAAMEIFHPQVITQIMAASDDRVL